MQEHEQEQKQEQEQEQVQEQRKGKGKEPGIFGSPSPKHHPMKQAVRRAANQQLHGLQVLRPYCCQRAAGLNRVEWPAVRRAQLRLAADRAQRAEPCCSAEPCRWQPLELGRLLAAEAEQVVGAG